MLVLVTGATGFVGREVVKALADCGFEIRCLVHTPGRESVLGNQQVDVHYGSVGDKAALRAAFYGVDAVVHLVGAIRQKGTATFQNLNRRGSETVVETAKDAGVKHFLYVSALGATDDVRYPYLTSKWQAEQAVINSGMPYTILRPSVQFGPGDEFINTLAGLVRISPVIPIIGRGRNRFQPIAVQEVAECVAAATGNDEFHGKTIEIGGPEHLSYIEIVDIITGTYQVWRTKLHIPIWAMRLVVRLMELLLPRPPATREQLRMLPMNNVSKLDTVEDVFGFTPSPLQGNINYIKGISFWEGVRISLGFIPRRIRDH